MQGRKRGRAAARSPGKDRTEPIGAPDERLLASATGAVVASVEAHPKQQGMYHVTLVLELPDSEAAERSSDTADTAADEPNGDLPAEGSLATARSWTDEVDEWISSAKQAEAAQGEWTLAVHEDTLVAWRLLKGRRLTVEQCEQLRQLQAVEDAYRAALALLSRKVRTGRELSDALKRKGYSPESITACLNRLKDKRMLDDAAYAKRFAEQRVTFQRKGTRLIRQELMQRGVGKGDVADALSDIDPAAERDAALVLARRKRTSMKGEPPEVRMKLTGYLLRRGFPGAIVRSVVSEVMSSTAWDDDSFDEGYDSLDADEDA